MDACYGGGIEKPYFLTLYTKPFTLYTIYARQLDDCSALCGEESPGSTKARWRITSAAGDRRESATENIPPKRPKGAGKGEMVR